MNIILGNCYRFNSGYDQSGNKVPVKQMNEAGSDRSFNLQLYLGDEFSQGEFMFSSGAVVAIHNQSVQPLMAAEGKFLSTKFDLILVLMQNKINTFTF